jgi:hypothetical protein
VAEAALASALGELERSRTLLEDAVDDFERGGGHYEAALARHLYGAPWVHAERQADQPASRKRVARLMPA